MNRNDIELRWCDTCKISYAATSTTDHICSTITDRAIVGDTPPIRGIKVNLELRNQDFRDGYSKGWIDAWEYWAKKGSK